MKIVESLTMSKIMYSTALSMGLKILNSKPLTSQTLTKVRLVQDSLKTTFQRGSLSSRQRYMVKIALPLTEPNKTHLS